DAGAAGHPRRPRPARAAAVHGLTLGAGPRASIALVRGGRARALLRGGEFVIPDDIKGCALAVLRHRVRLSPELDIEGMSVDQVLKQLLDQVPAPRQ
nr:hypothetical protein [Tanacetum cinerariifolium]